mmetsp:Transcript_45329/g.117431  ORF Transcript_45329/g.117431 Transcript_45329/m.117431 type:complete len:223 (-) Transcript_45329:466-1134(-)
MLPCKYVGALSLRFQQSVWISREERTPGGVVSSAFLSRQSLCTSISSGTGASPSVLRRGRTAFFLVCLKLLMYSSRYCLFRSIAALSTTISSCSLSSAISCLCLAVRLLDSLSCRDTMASTVRLFSSSTFRLARPAMSSLAWSAKLLLRNSASWCCSWLTSSPCASFSVLTSARARASSSFARDNSSRRQRACSSAVSANDKCRRTACLRVEFCALSCRACR